MQRPVQLTVPAQVDLHAPVLPTTTLHRGRTAVTRKMVLARKADGTANFAKQHTSYYGTNARQLQKLWQQLSNQRLDALLKHLQLSSKSINDLLQYGLYRRSLT